MGIQQRVEWGVWTDHSTGQTSLLVTDWWATVAKAYIATCLTLAGPYIFRALMRLLYHLDRLRVWAFDIKQSEDATSNEVGTAEERSGLLADNPTTQASRPEANQPSGRQEPNDSAKPHSKSAGLIIRDATSGRMLLANSSVTGVFALLLTIVFGVFVAKVIAGVFSAEVAGDRYAKWSSQHCGIWGFDSDNAGDEAAARADVFDREKEARSGQYAQSCYENSEMLQSMSCQFFSETNIPYSRDLTDPFHCPFDRGVCIPGTQSVTFRTPVVDSSRIGINAATTYKFRRTATCAPLSRASPYVTKETTNGSTRFHYNYGKLRDTFEDPPRIISNHTYSTAGDPFDQLAPVYNLRTYTTSLYPEYDYWQPLPELAPPQNSTLTIIFVSALRIYYLRRSEDPIFPADKEIHVDDYSNPWFYKSDPAARAMACVDTTEICSPSGKECWSMTDDRSGQQFPPQYWLLKFSLESSSIFDSINRRLGSALLAQEMVAQYNSPALNDTHWMDEAERLFATSLARIQFDAFNIASGEDQVHEVDGYVKQTPDEAGELCGLYKFQSTGYTNLNYVMLWVLGWPVLFACFLLTRETKQVVKAWRWVVRQATTGFYKVYPDKKKKIVLGDLEHEPNGHAAVLSSSQDTVRIRGSADQSGSANQEEDRELPELGKGKARAQSDGPEQDAHDHTQSTGSGKTTRSPHVESDELVIEWLVRILLTGCVFFLALVAVGLDCTWKLLWKTAPDREDCSVQSSRTSNLGG